MLLSLRTITPLSLAALLACDGGINSDETYEPAFTLSLTPVVPANQSPFESVDELLLVVESTDGAPMEYPLSRTSGSPTLDGVEPFEEATLAIEGYAGGELVAFGRTGTLSMTEGELSAQVLVGEVDAFAWTEGLDKGLHDASLVAAGDGTFLAFGGTTQSPNLGSGGAEDTIQRLRIADPGEDLEFLPAGTMPEYTTLGETYTGRSGATAILLEGSGAGEGTILVAGGANGSLQVDSVTGHAFLYDPATESIVYELEMKVPRWGQSVATVDGDVYFFGGVQENESAGQLSRVMQVELFDRETGTFEYLNQNLGGSSSYIPLFGAAASMQEDGALFCGGLDLVDADGDSDADWKAVPDCYAVSVSGVLSEVDAMPMEVINHQLTSLDDGRVLLTGGVLADDWLDQNESAPPAARIYVYDPGSGSWADTQQDLFVPRHHHAAALLPDGRVLIAGGTADNGDLAGQDSGDGLACAEIYDPSNNTLELLDDCSADDEVSSLPVRMVDPSVAVDPEYGVVLFGGLDDGGAVDAAALWMGRPR